MPRHPNDSIISLFSEGQAPDDDTRWELTDAGAQELAERRAAAGSTGDSIIDASLHREIAQLRELLHAEIARARETPSPDPIMAVTRLMMAVARAVQLQRALDARPQDGLDALTMFLLDELDRRDLELERAAGVLPHW